MVSNFFASHRTDVGVDADDAAADADVAGRGRPTDRQTNMDGWMVG